jgi:hypothetical protein
MELRIRDGGPDRPVRCVRIAYIPAVRKNHPLAKHERPSKLTATPAPKASRGPDWLQWRWPLALVVALAAVFVYVPALDAGWTDTDDIQLIVEDSHFLMKAHPFPGVFERPFFPAAGSSKHYYRPLVTLSFMTDARRAGGVTPSAFHSTNVLLHVLSCLLLLAIALHVTKNTVLSLAVVLIFAVHPAAVQTVAWVPGRSDGLMAVFALGSLLAWLKYDSSGSKAALSSHVGLLVLSLLCKETAVALVPIALSYSLFVSPQSARWRDVRPWLGWSIALGAWWILRSTQVDATRLDWHLLWHNAPMLIASLGKLIMLVDLHVLATLQDTTWWPGWIGLGLVLAAATWLSGDKRRAFVWASLGIPLFVLAPTLVVSDVLILDNRLYLAAAGLVLGFAILAEATLKPRPAWQGPSAALLSLGVVLLGAATVRYTRVFESPKAFCEAAVAGSPHLPLAHVNLGSAYFRDGDLDRAANEFAEAISLDSNWPVAHNNLGLVYLNQGQLTKAEREFTTELAVNPDYPKAHYNLGLVLANTGRQQAASLHFERVVQLVPSDVGAWGELLKYWGPRDERKAARIIDTMQQLGVRFHSPQAGQ